MIQLVVGDVFLDLYDEDLPRLTLSIEDIETTETTTSFSRQFRVPATTTNTEFFKSAFSINGRDFDISIRQEAVILVDGMEFQRGEIRLQQVFFNDITNQTDYGIIFLGDVRNFASAVGDRTMCELDLTNLAHEKTLANVTASWDAYPETPSTQDEGLLSGSIVYPLIDFGNSYNEDFVPQETRIENGGSDDNFTNSSHPLHIDRMRPCIKVKDIWDKIFENAGFTYTSTFLETNLFRHLYVGAWGDEAKTELLPFNYAYYSVNFGEIPQFTLDGNENVIPLNFQSSEGYTLSTGKYTVPRTGVYDISLRIRVNISWDVIVGSSPDATYTIRCYKNSSAPANQLISETYTVDSLSNGSFITEFFFGNSSTVNMLVNNESLAINDEIFWTIEYDGGTNVNDLYTDYVREGVQQEVSVNPALGLTCETTQIDFVKSIISKFRLVFAPDRNNPNNLFVEPWSNYIAGGQLFDWTEKLDLSRDGVLEPTLYTQTANITFKDDEAEDFLNIVNQQEIGEVYGTLNFNSLSNVLKGNRDITTNFEPLPVIQIDGAAQANNGMDNTIIAKIHDLRTESDSSNNAKVVREPVKPGLRLFWYDGFKHTGTTSARDNTWYLEDDTDSDSFTKFPMISEFNEWGDRDDSWQGLDTLTQTLNWQKENTFIRFDLAQTELGSSVYDNYWSQYISFLYNRWGRRYTAHFVLDANDLLEFNFDDVIFVKDAYYYVEKIYDVIVGEQSSVKVDLIKLNNFVPPSSGFMPPGTMWEELIGIANFWENINTNWEDV